MANDHFQFKQFKIVQRDGGMKVTTDACVFGALLADLQPLGRANILDIGTGTGLLALMAAQLHPQAIITAVEIESAAWHQASMNVQVSPWHPRITVIHQSIQDFEGATDEKFELIISNPPFYAAHQASQDAKRAQAHHTAQLSREELAKSVDGLLAKNGQFVVMLPEFESHQLEDLLVQRSIFPEVSIHVHNRSNDNRIFRVLTTYNRRSATVQYRRFDIRSADHQYTQEFVKYLSPFYLYL